LSDAACAEEQRHQLAVDTLEDLEWCLEQLETTQTDRSVSDLATNKVRDEGHVGIYIFKSQSFKFCFVFFS